MPSYTNLTRGLNLWGNSAGVNMTPGECLDAQDVLPRLDGGIFKHWGWKRLNPTALSARIIGIKGFTYKGKNSPAGSTARAGNYGIANDGADYTRRADFYTTGIVLTDTELRFWNPATETLDLPVAFHAGPVWLPPGVTINPDPKPTIVVHNDTAYITGWADANLKYDPADRVLYEWGWAAPPTNAGHAGPGGVGGTLIAGALYRYRASYFNVYTGEESELSVEYSATPAAGENIVLDNFAVYPGTRHYNDAAGAAGDDVGIVIYRSDPDGQTLYFLTTLNPGTTTYTDTGVAVDYSIVADMRDFQDPPVLNTMVEHKGMWWGLSWANNWTRVYYNDFQGENSFWERWDVRDYRELPLQEGETLTALESMGKSLVAMASQDAHEMNIFPNTKTGLIDISNRPLNWEVGCVGPKAKTQCGGYLYFLSDRGPYRWRPGMVRPEWIGKNLLPMFIDPQSDLCQMNEETRLSAEMVYDGDADVIRVIFTCGSSATLNRHLMYPLQAARMNGAPDTGWLFASTAAQALDFTNVFGPLSGGVPITPFDRRNRMLFSDADGYLYEYDPDLVRGGIPAAGPATGTVQAGSGVNLVVTAGTLYNTGDGLTGALLEIVYADGTIDVRRVGSNTATNIVPDVILSQDPTGATWYVGGIPAYWKSWVDSGGEPTAHKTVRHLYLGYNREFVTGDQVIDVSVYTSSEWPADVRRARTAALTVWRAQTMISLTGRYFLWEFANSRPDEPFMISHFEPEMQMLTGRRR